jgi:NADH:ubiquinone reductase (non-electrogenic)
MTQRFEATPSKPRVVVLGTGFGGFRFLKSLDTDAYSVTVISPRNYFLFTPLLPSTAVGTIEFRSIVEPIRLARSSLEFFYGACVGFDPEQKCLHCVGTARGDTFDVTFDILVISVGATTATFGVPGVEEHCLFLKDIPDAQAVRRKIITCFERASEPSISDDERRRELRFAIVGGGPTGIEFAAELHDLITEDLKSRYSSLMPLVDIQVLEAGQRILSTFDETLSSYTLRTFHRQKITIRTQSPVTAVEENRLLLQDGSTIDAGLIVWSAGIKATPFVESLPFKKVRGKLVTDNFLKIPEAENIYAIGDCAVIDGANFAATGQLAQQQGRYLANALNRRQRGKSVKPFHYMDMGMLAYVGSGKALMNTPGVKGRGFLAWLFWRSVYLTKLVSLRNKISVLFDWFRTFIFGRDFSKF